MGKFNWKLYSVIVGLVLMIPIWNLFFADYLKMLPSDFSYEAALLSVDNFYDDDDEKFLGDEISKSEFSYEVIDQKENVLIVENFFEVFTFEGQKIISVSRILGIDKYTGAHVDGFGDKDRTGYIFAPPGLKGGLNFEYWHVNYDVPVEMQYVGEEEIDGLLVYKYESELGSFEVDQSNFLGHLDGVPEVKGVKVRPVLQMWVEPTTGVMIKYKDDSEAYFYDVETGEDLSPWNFFSNEYVESSAKEKVSEVKILKWKFYIADYIVPFLLFTIALAIFILHLRYLLLKNSSFDDLSVVKSRSMIYGFVIVSFILLFTLMIQYRLLNESRDLDHRVGIVLLNESSSFVSTIESFVSQLEKNGYIEGENLLLFNENAGGDERKYVEILREYLSNDVDVIYTLTTTATKLAASETSTVPIVFGVVTYPVQQGLIDSMENSKNNLVGVRHNVPVAGQWFEFKKLMSENNLSVDKVVYVRGDGFKNTEIQYQEAKDYFDSEGTSLQEIVAGNVQSLTSQLNELEGDYVLYAGCDNFLQGEGGEELIRFAEENKKIIVSCIASLIPEGVLFSRSVDFAEVGRMAGDKASLILSGAEVNWLRTEQPQQHKVNINLDVAESLGIVIPFDQYENLVVYPNQDES